MSTSYYHYLRYSPNADAHHPHAAFTLPPRRPHAACTPPHAASTTTPPPHCVHAATCSLAPTQLHAVATPPPRHPHAVARCLYSSARCSNAASTQPLHTAYLSLHAAATSGITSLHAAARRLHAAARQPHASPAHMEKSKEG